MTVLIKNFGNDTECRTLYEFKQVLLEKYVGREVSIVYVLDSGINTNVFVKVLNDGSLIGSYDGKIVEYSQFNLK